MAYKEIDYNVIEERIIEVLEENDEKDIKGVAEFLMHEIYHSVKIDIDIVFDFCERYGCSVDYLLGRTDKYWL